jgi:uncharacterized repeat protein (TIGR01451 family)
MRQRTLQISGLFLITILITIGFSLTPAPAQAELLLQDTPRLDGYKIYFTEADGEASRFDRSDVGLSRFAGLLSELGATLETLEWRTSFPSDADLIVIAGPAQDLDASKTARLWTYLNNGGKLLFLAEPLAWERQRPRGLGLESGIFQLLWTDLGVRVRNDIVLTEGVVPTFLPAPVVQEVPAAEVVTADATAEVSAEATAEAAAVPTATQPFAPAPQLNFTTQDLSDDSAITEDLGQPLAFFTARSLEIDLAVRDYPVQPLAFSSSEFYGENNFPDFYDTGVAVYNIGQDVPPGFLPLAAAYENPNTNSRLVLIGDRDFATNSGGMQSSPPNTGAFLYPGNVRFLLNSVTWLLGVEPVEISLPTPGATSTPTMVPTPETVDPNAIQADLAVTIAVTNVRPAEGEIIIYDINVINNGPDEATNIVLLEELPTGLQFVMSAGGVYNSETKQWTLDGLRPDQGASLRMVVSVTRGTVNTTITNRVEILGSNAKDLNPENNVASIDVQVANVLVQETGE